MDDDSDLGWVTIGEAVDAVLAELGLGDRSHGWEDRGSGHTASREDAGDGMGAGPVIKAGGASTGPADTRLGGETGCVILMFVRREERRHAASVAS
jgi:hypothetical protein